MTSTRPRSSLSLSGSGCGSGQSRSSAASTSSATGVGGSWPGLHDFGAAGTSGSAVTGVPASRSGETKFTSRRTSLPWLPAAGRTRTT